MQNLCKLAVSQPSLDAADSGLGDKSAHGDCIKKIMAKLPCRLPALAAHQYRHQFIILGDECFIRIHINNCD